MTSTKEDIADSLEKMEGHLQGIAEAQADICYKGNEPSFSVEEADRLTESLASIAQSLTALVQFKKEKQRIRRGGNGLNYSPSPKHSKYLKRSLSTTADGRRVRGKVTFSRTGKRLFIQNRNGYTSA